MLQGLAGVLDMTFVSKLLEPGHPLLHRLLRLLRRSVALGTAIKIDKLAHGNSSFVCFLILERLRRTPTDNFLAEAPNTAGNWNCGDPCADSGEPFPKRTSIQKRSSRLFGRDRRVVHSHYVSSMSNQRPGQTI